MGLNADKIRFAAFRARQVHELRFGEKKGRKELHLYRHLLSPYEEMLSNVISTHRLQLKHISAKAILLPLTIYKPHAREQICVETFSMTNICQIFLWQVKTGVCQICLCRRIVRKKFVQDLWKISSRFLCDRVVWCFYRTSEPSELAVSDNFSPFESI